MKKLLFLLIVLHSFICPAFQSGDNQVKKIDGKNYLVYKVVAGDGWYGIARKFSITYAELRVANKNIDDKLFPGKEILIPADKLKINDPYFDKNRLNSEKVVPVRTSENKYHLVEPSQTLFSISRMYNVSVDQLKTWNNLTDNSISKGQKLIVGKAEVLEGPVSEMETVIKEEAKKEVIMQPTVVDVKPTSGIESTTTIEQVKTKEVVEVKTDEIKTDPAVSGIKTENTDSILPVEEIESPSQGEKVVFANGRREVNENGTAIRMDEEDQNQDKYYALHKTAPIGTIIRVSNLANSKKIYVKVIGALSNAPENDNVIIKLSKASVEKLGVTDKLFQVNLLYGVTQE